MKEQCLKEPGESSFSLKTGGTSNGKVEEKEPRNTDITVFLLLRLSAVLLVLSLTAAVYTHVHTYTHIYTQIHIFIHMWA